MIYVHEQNSQTLWLTDLHFGNFGWDGDELKVWDIGFAESNPTSSTDSMEDF